MADNSYPSSAILAGSLPHNCCGLQAKNETVLFDAGQELRKAGNVPFHLVVEEWSPNSPTADCRLLHLYTDCLDHSHIYHSHNHYWVRLKCVIH